MKHWEEKNAIKVLEKAGALVHKELKLIQIGGLTGLTACSARDYLSNHCGFHIVTTEVFAGQVEAFKKAEAEKEAEEKKAKTVANKQQVKAKQTADKKANKQRKNFNKAKLANKKQAINA